LVTADAEITTEVSPASETDSPHSDDALEPVIEQVDREEDASTSVQETETTALDWTDQELWEKRLELKRADFDPADWDKVSDRLGRIDQSIRDQQATQQEARRLARENQERIADLGSKLPDRLMGAVQAEMQAAMDEGRNVSPTLLKALVDGEASAVLGEIEPLVLMPWSASILADMARMAGPAAQKVLGDLQGQPFNKVINSYANFCYAMGQKASPEAQKLVKAEEQIAKLKAENLKLDGQLKGGGSGASTSGREARARNVSYEQLLKMSDAEVKALPKEVFDKAISGG
jgi:hypothetical protein